MFINSKIVAAAAVLAALTAQCTAAQAFGGGGDGPGYNFQIEYEEDDSENINSERRRLPALNEVPVVNSLFSNRGNTETRTRLNIQVQPEIVRDR